MPSVLDRAKIALQTPRHKQKLAAKQQLAAQSAPAPKVSLDQRIKWETKTITVEKCHDLITKCSVEIKARGLDIPLLCKPFHMDADYKRIISLVRNYFDKQADFVSDIKFAIVQDIIGVVKWALAHVRRDGQRGLLDWSVYDHFVAKEREQNFVKTAYQSDLARVIAPPLASMLDTLLDLLSSICAYSKINGYASTRLIKQFAIWILPTEHNILLDFANGYRDWLKSADAAEHIFLAYLRASTSPLPVRLAELLSKYPEPPPPPTRTIAVLRLLRSVNELSHNLLSDSLDWRVYPSPSASDWLALKSSGVVDSMANNLLLRNAMAQRKSGKPPTDRIQLNYHHPLHRSLIDKEWSDFADLGFKADSAGAVNPAENPLPHRAGDRILLSSQSIAPLRSRKRQQAQPLRKALTFDLNETERLQRRQKRSTIDWDSFQNEGFKGRETIEARELDLSIKEEEDEDWEDEQNEEEDEDFIVIDPQMKKHLQYLRKMGVQHGEPANVIGKVDIDEVFVDTWLECIIEAGGRIGTWITVEFKDGWSMLEEQVSQQALANAAAAALAAQAKAKKHPLLKSLAKVGKSKTTLTPQTGGVRLHSTTTTMFSPSKTTLPYSSHSTGNAPSTTTFSTISRSPISTPSTQAPSLYSTMSNTSLRPTTSDSTTTVKANNRMGIAFNNAVSLVKTTSRNMHAKSASASSAGSKTTIKQTSIPIALSADLPDIPKLSAPRNQAPEEKFEVLDNAEGPTKAEKALPIPKRSASIKAPSSPQLPSHGQFSSPRIAAAMMDTTSPPSSPRHYQSPVDMFAAGQQIHKPQPPAAPGTPTITNSPAIKSSSIDTFSTAAATAAGVVGAAALESSKPSNKSAIEIDPSRPAEYGSNGASAPQEIAQPSPQLIQPISKSKPKKAKGRGLTDFMDSLRGPKKQPSSPKGISSSNFHYEAKDAGSGKLSPAVPQIATSLEIQNARRAEEMAKEAERHDVVGPLSSDGKSYAPQLAPLQMHPNLGVPPPPLHSPAKSLSGSNVSSEDLKSAADAPPLPTSNLLQMPTLVEARALTPVRRSPSPARSAGLSGSKQRQASSPRPSPRPSPQSSPRNMNAALPLPPPQSPFSERPAAIRQPSGDMRPEVSRQTSLSSFSSSSLNTLNTQQRSASPLPSPVSPPIGSTIAEFPIPPSVSPAPAEYRRNSPSPSRRISAGIPANARSFIPPSVSLELSLVSPHRPDPPRSSSPHNYSPQAASYTSSPKRSSIPRPVEAPRPHSPLQFPRSATPTKQGIPAASVTTRLPRLSTSSRTSSISGRESPALLSPSSASSSNDYDEGSSKFKRASLALKQRLQGTVVGANAEGERSAIATSERARSPTTTSLPKRTVGSGIPVVASVSARVKQINTSAISQLPIRSNSSLSNRHSDEVEKTEKDRLKKEWKEREKDKRRSIARYGVGEERHQDPRLSVASSLDIEEAYGGIEEPVQERARQVLSVDTRGVEDYVNRMLK